MEGIKRVTSQPGIMADATETTTDMGLGVTLVFGVLAVLGALVMFAGAPDLTAAWGFAGAMVFGSLAVVAVHLYAE